jgi:serine/threonine protein kinase
VTGVAALQQGDPQRVGPYVLLGRLGSGGMGRVYLARSPGGRTVAVKVIRAALADDSGFRHRFAREVASARKVGGLYTAQVVDADVEGPVPWLVTAYVPGRALSDAVDEHGPLPAPTVLALAAGLAEGLNAIHAAGVIHRDLKPSNVLLAQDGPRIIDFGISSAADATQLTGTGFMIGSPGFMSPEQAEGLTVGPASDIFSLGCVVTFASRGEGPFGTGDTAALLYRIVHGKPNIDRVPDKLRPLVKRSLSREAKRRPSAAEFLADLTAAVPSAADLTDWLPAVILEAAGGPRTGPATGDVVAQPATNITPAPASPPPSQAYPPAPRGYPGLSSGAANSGVQDSPWGSAPGGSYPPPGGSGQQSVPGGSYPPPGGSGQQSVPGGSYPPPGGSGQQSIPSGSYPAGASGQQLAQSGPYGPSAGGAGQWYGPTPARRRKRPGWLLPAAVGAAAAGAIIAALVITLSPGSSNGNASGGTGAPTVGNLTLDQLKVGDCLTGSNLQLNTANPWPKLAAAVPCGQSHTAEVFYANDSFFKNGSYPGDTTISDQGKAQCSSAFESYVGIAYSKSRYTSVNVVPDVNTWPDGERGLHCVAYFPSSAHPSGTPIQGTIKGTGK